MVYYKIQCIGSRNLLEILFSIGCNAQMKAPRFLSSKHVSENQVYLCCKDDALLKIYSKSRFSHVQFSLDVTAALEFHRRQV